MALRSERMDNTKAAGSRAKRWLLSGAGALLVVAGVLAGWARVKSGGVDFTVLHVMGVGIARGVDVYALGTQGDSLHELADIQYPPGTMGLVVYPPATGFPMLPFALLPFGAARILWFLLLNASVVLGTRALVRLAAPNAPWSAWTLAAGVVLLSSGIRWAMILLQGAPAMLGLLCFFVVALHSQRPWLAAAIATLAVVFKVTLALPFLGLLFFHRRFLACGSCVACWVALNGVGFLRMGADAYRDYRAGVADFDALGPDNINSPDPWSLAARPRIDWASLFYGASGDLHAARLATLACSVLVASWLFFEWVRLRGPLDMTDTAAFLAPLVCLGCLSVYHHHYDLVLFFAPLLLACFGPTDLRRPPWAAALALPLVLLLVALPIGPAEAVARSLFGVRGIGLLKLTFPVAVTLTLGASLVILRRTIRNRPTSGEPRGPLGPAPSRFWAL